MLKNKVIISLVKSLNEKIKLFFGREYFKSRIIGWLLFFGILFDIVNWSVLKIFLPPAGNYVILHYNVYFGVDSMGAARSAYILPFIGTIVLFVNVVLSFFFYTQKERVASYVMLLTALMVQLSLLISAISVIIINY